MLTNKPTNKLKKKNPIIFDPNDTYENRKGYDKNFLGTSKNLTIELPTVGSMNDVYTIADYKNHKKIKPKPNDSENPFILKYHHYSLVMNCKYRMCLYTASNCDYTYTMRKKEADAQKVAETKKEFWDSRGRFGEDKWIYDPRVPEQFQMGEDDIYTKVTRIDMGHINRRQDNCWGDPDTDEDVFANSDTYHLTNCTPQHELFNQLTVKKGWPSKPDPEYAGLVGIWGDFESWFEYQIHFVHNDAWEVTSPGKRAVIFAGPVLYGKSNENEDKTFSPWENGSVKIPYRFWKVVVVKKDDKSDLLAAGFVFDQSDAVKYYTLDNDPPKKPMTVTPLYDPKKNDRFKRFQKSIADIQVLTGLTFPSKVLDADQCGKSDFPYRGGEIN